jgi:hypothetical protein
MHACKAQSEYMYACKAESEYMYACRAQSVFCVCVQSFRQQCSVGVENGSQTWRRHQHMRLNQHAKELVPRRCISHKLVHVYTRDRTQSLISCCILSEKSPTPQDDVVMWCHDGFLTAINTDALLMLQANGTLFWSKKKGLVFISLAFKATDLQQPKDYFLHVAHCSQEKTDLCTSSLSPYAHAYSTHTYIQHSAQMITYLAHGVLAGGKILLMAIDLLLWGACDRYSG